MSIIKVITPASLQYDEPSAQIVKLSQRGLLGADRSAFVKRASVDFLQHIDALREKVAEDETLVHLLAMGATEDYGANRNGDGFCRETCRRYHPTFVKYAYFYRNHKNKDPRKSYGRIIKSAFHEPMKRIELLVSLNSSDTAAARNKGLLADREMEKLAAGKDIPVSMACVTDPTYPVLTRDRGYVEIAKIIVGDIVWTHQQRWRKVTQLNRRRYTGEVHKFRVNGQPLPLELTADHPMWAKVFIGSRQVEAIKNKARRFFTDTAAFEKQPADWTHASHIGVGDRFFYRPITKYTGYGKISDVRLAEIMGYYLAEGSFGYNGTVACTTEFTCNIADSLPRRLPKLLESMYPDITVDISPRDNSDAALAVKIFNTKFSEFLRQYVGRGCKNKTIPPEIFNAADEVKLSFLGAWLEGDGWVDKKGGHWSTANQGLALQGRDLLATIGIPSSIYKIDHAKCKTSGYKNSGIEYVLNISHLDLWNLSGYSTKVSNYPTVTRSRNKPASMRYCPDGSYAYRIAEVNSRFVSDIATYNFEVEEDESYSLGGFISHNCKVAYDICSYCGNKAPTVEDYCDDTRMGGMCKAGGLRDHIGALVEIDGGIHQLHADNPHPSFFDISHVFRPADRIAYITGAIEKSAAANGRIVKSADLAKKMGISIPYELMVDGDQPKNIQHLVKLAYQLADIETAIANRNCPISENYTTAFSPIVQGADIPLVLPPLLREKFALGLRALADQQICLPLARFIEVVADHSTEKAAEVAIVVARELPGIYTRLTADGELPARVKESKYTPASAAAPPQYAGWAAKLAADLSLAPQHMQNRVARAALHMEEPNDLQTEINHTKTASVRDPAKRMAEEYALYKLAFLGSLSEHNTDLPLTAALALLQNYTG